MIRRLVIVILLALCPLSAPAQNVPVYQIGAVTPGHAAMWSTTGVLQDAGGPSRGLFNALGVTAAGLPLCVDDSLTGPYHELCFGANVLGGGAEISYNAYGGAAPLPMTLNLNGVSYPFPTGFRLTDPTNLYVATSGNDGNTCTTVSAPCLTIQHAVNLALAGDFSGQNVVINIAAGTYNMVGGVQIGGSLPGAANGTELGASMTLLGAGSATTTISLASCTGNPAAIFVGGGAFVQLGGLRLTTACSGGSDLVLYQGATVQLANGDLNLGAASTALVDAYDRSTFTGNSTYGLTISGGAAYAFLISTHSTVILSAGATNTLSGTPAFSTAFIDAVDESFFDLGVGSSFSGTATGVRYALALNSVIDTEQSTAALPGNSAGSVSSGSYYYTNSGIVCVGGAAGCRITIAPTNLGTGGSAIMAAGSGDHGGSVTLVAGSSAGTSGVVWVAQGSLLGGDLGTAGNCAVSLGNAGANWAAGATVQTTYTSGGIEIAWFNGGVALTNTGNYGLVYVCQ